MDKLYTVYKWLFKNKIEDIVIEDQKATITRLLDEIKQKDEIIQWQHDQMMSMMGL